ncbi:MAG: cysteine desulfurase [Candidatus Yonathbacteria bacterium]|nr:cysteine desulfurase [Candidatus Yonathbacteria bacterium]
MISKSIKNNFPFFNEQGKNIAYLDNAASSQTPQAVIDGMNAYYSKFRANIHRGLYDASEKASAAYEDARAKIARFIGGDPKEIIFTAGATASSNILITMLDNSVLPNPFVSGDEVVTTVMEHHSSLIPLQKLAERKKLKLKYLDILKGGVSLDYEEAEKMITAKTKIVSVCLASNVTGEINDVARIAKVAHTYGAIVICDATAAVGHIPIDVKTLGVDFLYFSGHKICGPTGIGILWGKKELLNILEPGIYGGGMVSEISKEGAKWKEAPMRFEAGTPNIAGVIGLGDAIDYLEAIGIQNIRAHNVSLIKKTFAELEKISGIQIVAEKNAEKNIGIISFLLEGIHPHDIAEILSKEGVAIRAGYHCAVPLHRALNISGTARASFYFYNTEEDIDALIKGIKIAKGVFRK